MDIDGTVLTEFFALDGYLNIDQRGDYELRFNGTATHRTMLIHVAEK